MYKVLTPTAFSRPNRLSRKPPVIAELFRHSPIHEQLRSVLVIHLSLGQTLPGVFSTPSVMGSLMHEVIGPVSRS